ncbi:MAG: exodeoxyribonuclease VII small subunit [Syntrophomonadaceae bacterium]|nr:exodeoxyribonuclease VII small subunit [Syntrophomonadaceae bacterium]
MSLSGIDFEQALQRLEELVRLLESGELSLEESLKSFEEGIGLIRICNERLSFVEKRVHSLIELTGNTDLYVLQQEGEERADGSGTLPDSESK